MAVEFFKYKSLRVMFQPRKKVYTFQCKHLDTLRKICITSIIPKYVQRYIFGKKGDTFTIPEFGLLELDYILSNILDNEELINHLGIAVITVEDILSYIRTNTWVAGRYQKIKSPINYKLISKEMKFNILPSQKPAFEKYEEVKVMAGLRGAMVDAAPGAGKTFMSLALSSGLGYDTTIIIAPRQTLEEVWVKSVTDTLFKKPQSYIVLDKKHKDIKNKRFIIFHYEFLEKVIEDKNLMKQLKRLKPNLIIDEFHNFNNIKSNRTVNLLNFVNELKVEDIILLTGTPIKMDINELMPLLYVLDVKFPSAITFFMDIYKVYDIELLNMLKYRFGLYRKRIEKDTSNIPPLTVTEYKVKLKQYDKYLIENIQKDMSEYRENRYKELMLKYNDYYKEFLNILDNVKNILIKRKVMSKTDINNNFKQYLLTVNEIFKLVEGNKFQLAIGLIRQASDFEINYIEKYLEGDELKRFRDIKSIIKYPKLKALGEALGKILLARRIECYTDLAKVIDYKDIIESSDKKTVIFSNYVITCETAKDTVIKQKYHPLSVYGEHTKQLDETVRKFMDPKSKYNPLIATYKSLSTGVPLIAANTMICLDLPFRMYIFDQTVSRIYRLGQDKRTFVFTVKLDTGDTPNITQKDLYILNISKMRVELITDNEFAYEIPEETLGKEEDIEEEVEEDMSNALVVNLVEDIAFNSLTSVIKDIREKIKDFWEMIKLKIES